MPDEFFGSIVLQSGCGQFDEAQCTQYGFEITVLNRQSRQVDTWGEIELSHTVEIGGGLWRNHAFGTVAEINAWLPAIILALCMTMESLACCARKGQNAITRRNAISLCFIYPSPTLGNSFGYPNL